MKKYVYSFRRYLHSSTTNFPLSRGRSRRSAFPLAPWLFHCYPKPPNFFTNVGNPKALENVLHLFTSRFLLPKFTSYSEILSYVKRLKICLIFILFASFHKNFLSHNLICMFTDIELTILELSHFY